MTSTKFVLYFFCLFLWKRDQITSLKPFRQDSGFVSVKAGDKLTLHCFYEVDDSAWLFWYKQTLGQKPKLISSFYVYDIRNTFYDEFKNNNRFTLETGNGTNHLTILNLSISDSATYLCANSYTYLLTFAEEITISVRGPDLKIQTLIHQSASETIKPGESVTLNCTIHTGTCDEEHSVYWFKESGESHPGIVYTNDDRNNQCERKPDTQTHMCVYNLQMKNLTRSHAGTYYCAVASCGKILLGNGTNVDIEYEVKSYTSVVYFLSGALTFTSILAVLLTFTLFKIIKRNKSQRTGSQLRFSHPHTTNTEVNQDSDNLQYAALRVNLPNRSKRQKINTESECVYSSVKV
ncbi:V-set and immunoglobulin domain-containing protein 1-like [Channa argus]|uniref:V-set and immunoglobulin domain-containing protein 1-like n=1 Tax=Channa argus TaxID=215402 RepID=UPI003520AFB8